MGAAWPFESTKRSLASELGLATSNFMAGKKTPAMRSAAERHEVGWPEPAAVVMRKEWMRSRLAFSRSCSRLARAGTLCPVAVMAGSFGKRKYPGLWRTFEQDYCTEAAARGRMVRGGEGASDRLRSGAKVAILPRKARAAGVSDASAVARRGLRTPNAAKESGIYSRRGADPGGRNRRDHDHVQRRRFHPDR